jgi:vacuolar-type H+-ATPase subunit H
MLLGAAREAPERRSQRVFLCFIDRKSRVDPVRRPAARSCVEKEGCLEAPRDPLLQDLIHHEKTVAGKVEEARREAERIVAQARAEARETLDRARREGDELAKAAAEKANEEAQAARERIVAQARDEVASIERLGTERRDRAVTGVLEQVLP